MIYSGKRAHANRRSNLASFFARLNSPPIRFNIYSEWRLLFYFFSNRGVKLISLAGMSLILSFSRISSLFRKLNSWCEDWLFSFFLHCWLCFLIISETLSRFSSSKDTPLGKTRRIISCATSHPPF